MARDSHVPSEHPSLHDMMGLSCLPLALLGKLWSCCLSKFDRGDFSVRRHKKLPPCWTRSAKAEPISDEGSASRVTYLGSGEKAASIPYIPVLFGGRDVEIRSKVEPGKKPGESVLRFGFISHYPTLI